MTNDTNLRDIGCIDRRDLIAGLVAGSATLAFGWSAADAEEVAASDQLFANTPLAGNALAKRFARFESALPDIPVITAAGPAKLSGVGGKTRLLSIWADWCVPCLVEIRDFAKLRPQVASDRFDIGLLATASGPQFDREAAVKKLGTLGAASMPLLIEENGMRVAKELAIPPNAKIPPGRKEPGFSLPCTLVVDATGHVRGRMFGSPDHPIPGMPHPKLTDAQKAAMAKGQPVRIEGKPLSQADKARILAKGSTMWLDADGLQFLHALADGILAKV